MPRFKTQRHTSSGSSMRDVQTKPIHLQISGKRITLNTRWTDLPDGIDETITLELNQEESAKLVRTMVFQLLGTDVGPMWQVLGSARIGAFVLNSNVETESPVDSALVLMLTEAMAELFGCRKPMIRAEGPRVELLEEGDDGYRG